MGISWSKVIDNTPVLSNGRSLFIAIRRHAARPRMVRTSRKFEAEIAPADHASRSHQEIAPGDRTMSYKRTATKWIEHDARDVGSIRLPSEARHG